VKLLAANQIRFERLFVLEIHTRCLSACHMLHTHIYTHTHIQLAIIHSECKAVRVTAAGNEVKGGNQSAGQTIKNKSQMLLLFSFFSFFFSFFFFLSASSAV